MLAQSLLLDGAWITAGAAVLGIFIGLIKIMDRLYLEPKQAKANGYHRVCAYDHQRILDTEARMEAAIEKMVNSQTALIATVEAMMQDSKHNREIDTMRHKEVMRTLELLERKMDDAKAK